MAKYLSGRVKRDPQSAISVDRYKYLDLKEAEPDLGDPLIGSSSIDNNPVVSGQQYIIVAVGGFPGKRYWIPNQGGIIPGSISVFDESNLVGVLSKNTQLNFIGAAVTALQLDGTYIGVSVTSTGNIGIYTNVISGIITTGISTGYLVVNDFVPFGSSVISIGASQVGISLTTTNSTVGNGITFSFNPGYNPKVDIKVFSPGNNQEIIFNTNTSIAIYNLALEQNKASNYNGGILALNA